MSRGRNARCWLLGDGVEWRPLLRPVGTAGTPLLGYVEHIHETTVRIVITSGLKEGEPCRWIVWDEELVFSAEHRTTTKPKALVQHDLRGREKKRRGGYHHKGGEGGSCGQKR